MSTVDLSQLKDLIKPAAGGGDAGPVVAEGASDEIQTPQLDKLGRAYGTGRRKSAVARLWLKSGAGQILVNGKEQSEYFPQALLRMHLAEPLTVLEAADRFDIVCTVKGSGPSGQAGAIRHALARALVDYKPEYRSTLKPHKLLRRDAREVERKKYGQPGARKRYQFSKR